MNTKEPIREMTGIAKISVRGYKSIYQEQAIDIAPLTLLAGANSSGKSSMMQPLLLLKQTLEARYNTVPLLLDGSHVKFTSTAQLFSQLGSQKGLDEFSMGIEMEDGEAVNIVYKTSSQDELYVDKTIFHRPNTPTYEISAGMSHEQILAILPNELKAREKEGSQWVIERSGCLLDIVLRCQGNRPILSLDSLTFPVRLLQERHIDRMIHLPGLRGNPERHYPTTAIYNTNQVVGTFENYVARLIRDWQINQETAQLKQLGQALEKLGLTWKVEAKPVDANRVELRVGRLVDEQRESDLVSIADVGFGVSQTLPVIVALLVAKPGQIVYIEQPEIHLHPRAQINMAQLLADAANRGVKVVAETHSSLLLRGIQTLVTQGQLAPERVKLHWFTRDQNGATVVDTAALDENGAFGEEWPEDFGEVELDAEQAYLDAVMYKQAQ
jgi:predicted ATPase